MHIAVVEVKIQAASLLNIPKKKINDFSLIVEIQRSISHCPVSPVRINPQAFDFDILILI